MARLVRSRAAPAQSAPEAGEGVSEAGSRAAVSQAEAILPGRPRDDRDVDELMRRREERLRAASLSKSPVLDPSPQGARALAAVDEILRRREGWQAAKGAPPERAPETPEERAWRREVLDAVAQKRAERAARVSALRRSRKG